MMTHFPPYSLNRYIDAILLHPVHNAIESLALMRSLEVLLRRPIAFLWILVPQIRRQVGVARQRRAQRLDAVVDVRAGDGGAIVLEQSWHQTVRITVPRGELPHHVQAVQVVEDFDPGDVSGLCGRFGFDEALLYAAVE